MIAIELLDVYAASPLPSRTIESFTSFRCMNADDAPVFPPLPAGAALRSGFVVGSAPLHVHAGAGHSSGFLGVSGS